MLSKDVYRDTEVAALKNISKLCEERGLLVDWRDAGFEAKGDGIYVIASIRPKRECDGICLVVNSRLGRRILDGQDYQFLSEEAQGCMRLNVYLASIDGELY